MKKIFEQPVLKVVLVKNNIIATSGEPGWSSTEKSADNALVGGRDAWGDEEDF